ncbi:hypothetical protein QBC37DRAFT_367180 [Rhypophila decipiens]|uniref:Uncharacterized protein n=1 Tax=Rhypophila decipiens TaxID=261697 RepID=A0AAN7BG22_9PEZI|nr:hypothetical protein QBC37DRAFT_367180 [Rhypophila decipiens]
MADFIQPFNPGPVNPAGVGLHPAIASRPHVTWSPEPFPSVPPEFWPLNGPGPVIPHNKPTEVSTQPYFPTIYPTPPPEPPVYPDRLVQKQEAEAAIAEVNYQLKELRKELDTLDNHIDEIESIRRRVRQYLRREFPFSLIRPQPKNPSLLEKKIDEKLAEVQREILGVLVQFQKKEKELLERRAKIKADLWEKTGITLAEDDWVYYTSFLSGGVGVESEWEDVEDDDDDEWDGEDVEVIFDASDWDQGLQKRGDPSGAAPETLFVAPAGTHPYGHYPVPPNITFDNLILGINEPYAKKKEELPGSHNRINNPSEKHLKKEKKQKAKEKKLKKEQEKEGKIQDEKKKSEEIRRKNMGEERWQAEQKKKAEEEERRKEKAAKEKYGKRDEEGGGGGGDVTRGIAGRIVILPTKKAPPAPPTPTVGPVVAEGGEVVVAEEEEEEEGEGVGKRDIGGNGPYNYDFTGVAPKVDNNAKPFWPYDNGRDDNVYSKPKPTLSIKDFCPVM